MAIKYLTSPLNEEAITGLRTGDRVFISGKIFTARDAAHKRFMELLNHGVPLPFDVAGQIIYYVGLSPSKPGRIIGSGGPTTSYRMDPYTVPLLEIGLKGMIGKGPRSPEIKQALIKHKAIYFAAIGGVAALSAKVVRESKIIAFDDLGPEAVRELMVENFPIIVINDIYGGDYYEESVKEYSKKKILASSELSLTQEAKDPELNEKQGSEKTNLAQEALTLHRTMRGKMEIVSKLKVNNAYEYSLAYTPGVAEPCREIQRDPSKVFELTARGNVVAIVTDGTAVLGMGDIGPQAAMPVMEGKAVLFKVFAGVEAFPLCLQTKDVDKIVETVTALEPTFGGINLEHIAAPRCFEVERRLKATLSIPVFHDDQHGTAIVALAGLINALKVTGKQLTGVRVVTNGAGLAGIAIVKLLLNVGFQNVIMCDRQGAIYEGRPEGMNSAKEEIARLTNRDTVKGGLVEALAGADVFIGISAANTVTPAMVRVMAKDPVIMAMANPEPEIMPDLARKAGARVICTSRSDFPNQINNVLVFPGIFRGTLDVRASDINETMKIAAAHAIAGIISEQELNENYVIPQAFDLRVAPAVAAAVARAAMESGVACLQVNPAEVAENTRRRTALK